MQNTGSLLIVLATFIILAVACGPVTGQASSTTASEQASIATPTEEAAAVGVPAVKYSNGPSELVVVSSATGGILHTFAPIPLGEDFGYSFAPDGKMLAVVSDGRLSLIDLPSWKYRTAEVDIHGWPASVIYSPDGTMIAMAGGEPAGKLCIVDVRDGAVKASAAVGFAIRNMKFTADRQALMIYGPQLAVSGQEAQAGVSVGPPQAALLSVSNLATLWSAKLQGVRAGTFPKKADTTDIFQPGAAWHYEPGVAFAPQQDILYVVHGDEDKMTIVDFPRRRVNTIGLHTKQSWLDRLMSLTAGVAYAKGMDGTSKQAVISPDGAYLYVVGAAETVTQRAKGTGWDMTDSPLDLQVIAVKDGTVTRKTDAQANLARLSPDGKQLFLTGWKQSAQTWNPWTDVYEIASGRVVRHFEGMELIPTYRMDGKIVLLSTRWLSDRQISTLIDPETWATAGSWKEAYDLGWLQVP